MNFSKKKVILFFLVVVVLMWFLYPRELFLGFIYEGKAELQRSEEYYKGYLKERPESKFAALRLVHLYERMGFPEKGIPFLEELFLRRPRDWEIAEIYMSHLDDLHEEEKLYNLRRQIAKRFMEAPVFPQGKVVQLLDDALQYAVWRQKSQDVFEIIDELLKIAHHPEDYIAVRLDYFRGLQKTEELLRYLRTKLEKDPKSTDTRTELSSIYLIEKEKEKALTILEEGLAMEPQNKELLEARLNIHMQYEEWRNALKDVQTLFAIRYLEGEDYGNYYEVLGNLYHHLGEDEKWVKNYRKAVHDFSLPQRDILFFIEKLEFYYRDHKQMKNIAILFREALQLPSLIMMEKLPFVEKLSYLYAQNKEDEKRIALLNTTLGWNGLKIEDRYSYTEQLINIYLRQHQIEKVFLLYEKILAEFRLKPEDRQYVTETYSLLLFKHKEQAKGEALLKKEMVSESYSPRQQTQIMTQLAEHYFQIKQAEKAVTLYRQAIEKDPDNKEHWLNLAYLFERMHQTEAQIALLEKMLTRFSQDKTIFEALANLYLYIKKDPNRLDIYWKYVSTKRNEDFGLGVLDLLLKSKKNEETNGWILKMVSLFPKNNDILSMAAYFFIEQKQGEEGLKLYLKLLKRDPKNPYLFSNAARFYDVLQQPEKSEEYYQKLVSLNIREYKILKSIGINILFAGNAKRALYYLEKGVALNDKDPELMFWYSEASISQGLGIQGIGAAEKTVALLEKKQGKTEEEERTLLKSKGRISFNDSIHQRYAELSKKYPHNIDIRTDYIDLLIDFKDLQRIDSVFESLLRDFPEQGKALTPYKIRVAFAQGRWEEATRLLTEILEEKPYLWSYKRDLAEAYSNSGEWEKAIKTYEEVRDATGDQLRVAGVLKELYKIYDHRITGRYTVTDFGADDFKVWETEGSSFINSLWQLKAKTADGYFKSVTDGYEDHAEWGKFTLGTDVQNGTSFAFGTGFGRSSLRQFTPSGYFSVTHKRSNHFQWNAGIAFRELRTDFPEAVSGGTLRDKFYLNGEWVVSEHFFLYGEYSFKRNYLPGDEKAYEQFAEPGFSFSFGQNPQWNFGYYYTFSRVFGKGGFLVLVPLVERLSSHIVTITMTERLGKSGVIGVTGFAGEDTAKPLHLLKGDLFGFSGYFDWSPVRWLDFKGTYSFSRESLASVSGTSRQFGIALSGHWH